MTTLEVFEKLVRVLDKQIDELIEQGLVLLAAELRPLRRHLVGLINQRGCDVSDGRLTTLIDVIVNG